MNKHKFLSFMLSGIITLTALHFPQQHVSAYDRTVTFERFSSAVNDGEPIKGVDISSIISVERAGVVFHDADGNQEDIFKILADYGVNYIRVRVWNQPSDAEGHSYGGGNNDVTVAAEIGRRAAMYGMKLLVDFQYSDFWADPEKQTPPKAWSEYSLAEKGSAIYYYTLESLETIRNAGADIGMVQIGNETNQFFCGETDMYHICEMFTAGCNAVNDFDADILKVLHFADPSTGYYSWYAKVLNECSVDYDVFATSYYPYWQGTAENMSAVLKEIADTYGKYVMVAETAYPYTDDDGDKFGNVIYSGSSGVDFRYDISVEGQAECLTDVFQAVANIGEKGLGVFYWEPAWLGKADTGWNEHKQLWDEFGSGWATSYAGEYDHSITQTGGSSYDNQALFDFNGYPLESLEVFSNIYPQKYSYSASAEADLPNGIYTIRNVNSNLYLNADADGNVIQSEESALFHLTRLDDGSYLITDQNTNSYLTIEDSSFIHLGSDAQNFYIAGKENACILFTDYDHCVEIFDQSIYSGSWVTYGKSLLNSSQKFELTLIEEDAELPTEPESESYTEPETEPSLKGDIDQNQEISLTDVVLMQKYLLGKEKINVQQWESADLNGDNTVNVFDLILIKRLVLSQ